MIRSATPESNSSQPASSSGKYKGVRLRKWGKYVSEIRLPNSRERIWLGSYDSAVKAARAFDAAQFCLRGPSANFNFPDNLPDIPGGRSLTPGQIQVEAARFANSWYDPQPVSDNPGAEVQQQADAASNTDQAGVGNSLLDEFRTMRWESESVSEFGYFQGFDDFQNELLLSGTPYVDDEEVEETSDQSFTTNASFLWNF